VILDGAAIAKQISQQLKDKIARRTPPSLAVILCSGDQASKIYVAKKTEACNRIGIKSKVIETKAGPGLFNILDHLNQDPAIDGIMVQLPLPRDCGISNHEIFDRINPLKDVDVFNPVNVGLLLQGRPRFVPCTPHAIQELLVRSGIAVAGKKVAIINRSDVVGKPLKALLIQDNEEANATVTICHDRTPPGLLRDVCQTADIIVVAVGIAGFITPELVNNRSIVVDVGINRIGKKIVGDVRADVYPLVAAYSPVPGGVGPLTVAMLMHNTIEAQEIQPSFPL